MSPSSRAAPRRLRRGLRWAARIAALVAVLFLVASGIGSWTAVQGDRGAPAVAPQRIGSYENVSFRSRVDGFRLSGWLFHSPHPTGRSIIMVHGWHGDREDVDFPALARHFLAEGYDVLLYDQRGSGTSAGMTQTFATDEPRDLLGAYDYLRSRGYLPRDMVVLGNSMGAATVIETAPQLGAVGALVCDSAYTTVTGAAEAGLTDITGLPGWLALPALQFSRLWGVDPAVSPIAVVASLHHRAFLFIQATHDGLVNPHSAALLRAASADPQSRLLMIDGKGHLATYNTDPSLYLATVDSFINQQLAQSAA